jgi:uncharacterized protein YdhG (YjbR/CyaY superfamily)
MNAYIQAKWKELGALFCVKNHIGFYPTPSAIEKFKSELTPFQTSKGAIQFPFEKPIPQELVKNITLFRVRELKSVCLLLHST